MIAKYKPTEDTKCKILHKYRKVFMSDSDYKVAAWFSAFVGHHCEMNYITLAFTNQKIYGGMSRCGHFYEGL